jgi:hypothetical protein
MQYIRIVNWEKFQQYKDREPKWIKMHRSLLKDYEFNKLSDNHKAHLMLIWLLAAETGNEIPFDEKWIQDQIQAKSKINLKMLISSGFIETYTPVQDCTENEEDVYLETEKRQRREETEKRESKGVYREFVFLTDEEYQKLVESFGDKETSEYIDRLNDYIGSTGKKYKSHYHTILNWSRKDASYGNKINRTNSFTEQESRHGETITD